MAYKSKKFPSDFENYTKEGEVQLVQDSAPVVQPEPQPVVQKKTVDKDGILKHLAYNRWAQTPKSDLLPVVEKMLAEGADHLLTVRWFLSYKEREKLLSEIKSKFGIL